MTLTDGTPLSPALGIGAFAEKTLVAAGQATKVDPAAQPEAAGLLGCGVMAGLGAAMYTGDVGRGDSVAVFGCGGVGNAAIAGARLAGRQRRSSRVDVDDREARVGAGVRRDAHRRTRATTDPVEAIRALTDGNGADVCIEAVGRPEVLEQAFYARDLAGTVVQVGVPDPTMTHRAADDRVLRPRRRAQAVAGTATASRHATSRCSSTSTSQGRLDLDRFVSETIALDEVEDAFHKMERGEVLRSVVVL